MTLAINHLPRPPKHGQNNGPFIAYTLSFGILVQFFGSFGGPGRSFYRAEDGLQWESSQPVEDRSLQMLDLSGAMGKRP